MLGWLLLWKKKEGLKMKDKKPEDMTLAELKALVKEAESAKQKIDSKGMEYCIVRTYSAGVFAGLFNRKNKGKEGTVYDARRLWKWSGALDCSQLAMKGVDNPKDCKFSTVSEVDLREIIEVSPCTKQAEESIKGVAEWSK